MAKADKATEPAMVPAVEVVILEVLAMANGTAPAKIITSPHVVGISAR
jgi:hypothetical protein